MTHPAALADEPGEALRHRFADAEFDQASGQLRVAGQVVVVEPRPLRLLQLLLRHVGEVVTKEELLDTVWEGRPTVDHVVANAVSKLRSALGPQAAERLQTVPRIGYRLMGPVQRVAAAPPQTTLTAGHPVPGREGYLLERPLGSGTRGDVWRARHAKLGQVHVFKFASDGPRLAALKREYTLYRVLAQELGPRDDIARVLDANFLAPPFWLECEDGGQSLLDWADGGGLAGLARGERLALFVQLAQALSAAHGVGVLHKDLKPANVLIAGQPGAWQVRLTDFGSGRLLEPARLEALKLTALGLTQTAEFGAADSGTFLYLAPEVLAGQSPSVRSDVYALGLMLYQWLAGDLRRPLATGWEAEVGDALLVADIAAATQGDPDKRLASAAELSQRLAALPARRAAAEAERAAQALLREREAQLARSRARRPWVLAAFAALAVGAAASVWQLVVARQAVQVAEAARREADAVSGFIANDLLALPDVVGSTVEEAPSMLDMLQQASRGLGTRFAHQPLVEAGIRLQLGRAFARLASNQLAGPEYERATALRAAHVPKDDDTLAVMRFELASLMCRRQYKDRCVQDYEAALRDAAPARLGRVDELGVAEVEARLGVMSVREQHAEAAAVLRALLRQADTGTAEGLDRALRLRGQLGWALSRQRDEAGMAALLQEVSSPPFAGHPMALATAVNLRLSQATRLRDDRRLEQAEQVLLEVQRSLAPPAPASAWHIANVRSELGHVYNVWQRPAQAAEQYGEAARYFARGLGRRHQAVWITQKNRVRMLNDAGQPEEALRTAREIEPAAHAAMAAGRDLMVTIEIARALAATGRAEEAEQHLRQVAQPASTSVPDDLVGFAWAAQAYRGLVLTRLGQKARGESLARQAREVLKKADRYPTTWIELDTFLERLP